MRKHWPYILLFLLITLSCAKSSPDVAQPADLSFTLALPAVEVNTRAGYADGNVSASDASTWKNWERFVDGQLLYRVTVLLVRTSDMQLVGYRDFYLKDGKINDWCDNSASYGINGFCTVNADGSFNALQADNVPYGTALKVTFNYAAPMHGSIEKLVTGNYRIYAVANYSPLSGIDSESGSKNYVGLKDDGDYTGSVNEVISAFNGTPDTGVAKDDWHEKLAKYYVRSAQLKDGAVVYSGGEEQYVCEQRPQPLSMKKDLVLLSGSNSFSGELLRMYSRVRFELTNESLTYDLTLNSFSFGGNFAQTRSCLFDDEGYDTFSTGAWLCTPVLDSELAIHPYAGDGSIVIPKGASVSSYNSAVIFDAYVLQSSLGAGNYKYRVDVEYKDAIGVDMKTVTLVDGKPIRTLDDLKAAYNAGTIKYLMANLSSKTFLYDNFDGSTKRVEVGKDILDRFKFDDTAADKQTLAPVDASMDYPDFHLETLYPAYVWTFEKTGDWNFYIENEKSGQFWNNRINKGDPNRLTTEVLDYTYYEVISGGQTVDANKGLVFHNSQIDPSSGYLVSDNSRIWGWGVYNSNNNYTNASYHWILYPCKGSAVPQASKVVVLQAFDFDSGVPQDVESILRNDYIRTDIRVVFHPDVGTMKFIVKPWEQKTAEIIYE